MQMFSHFSLAIVIATQLITLPDTLIHIVGTYGGGGGG